MRGIGKGTDGSYSHCLGDRIKAGTRTFQLLRLRDNSQRILLTIHPIIIMSSAFECLFRKNISENSWGLEDVVKCVTVDRKRSDGRIFLQVRHFVRATYTPTPVGVSFSTQQAYRLLEQIENMIRMEEPHTRNEHLTPEGLHSLSGSAWIGVAKEGKEVLLMRENDGWLKGVKLSLSEYIELKQCFGTIHQLMFPTPHPKNVEIMEALGYELNHIFNILRYENCKGCEMELGNQEGHDCVMLDIETMTLRNLRQGLKRVNIPQVMIHVTYLHDLLKCDNSIPTIEEVMNFLDDTAWYMEHIQKENNLEPLLTSFNEMHQ